MAEQANQPSAKKRLLCKLPEILSEASPNARGAVANAILDKDEETCAYLVDLPRDLLQETLLDAGKQPAGDTVTVHIMFANGGCFEDQVPRAGGRLNIYHLQREMGLVLQSYYVSELEMDEQQIPWQCLKHFNLEVDANRHVYLKEQPGLNWLIKVFMH